MFKDSPLREFLPPPAFSVVAGLAAVLFFRMLGVFIILPVAAIFADRFPNASPLAAGVLLGGYGLTQALAQIPFALLADRIGRKPALLGALALFTAGGFVAAAAEGVDAAIFGRLLQGAGAVAAAAAAWVADVTSEARRAGAMAVLGAAIAAAWVASLIAAPQLAAAAGLGGVFETAGWLGVAAIALLLTLPAPPRPESSADADGADAAAARRARPVAILRQLAALPALRHLAAGAFVLHYAMAAVFFLLPPAYVRQIPADILPVADHWYIYFITFFWSLFIWTPLLAIRRESWRRFVIPAAVAFAGAGAAFLAAAVLSPSPLDLYRHSYTGLVLFFGGFTALEALLPAAAATAAPPQNRAAAIGFVISAQFIGVFLGGAASGALPATAAAVIPPLLFAAWLAVLAKNFRATT